MAARFWVGGTGNWDASTTTHWATSSGGTGGASVPGASDTVTFDGNSGTTPTITVTATATVGAVTLGTASAFTGGTLLLSAPLNVTTSSGGTGAVTVTTGTLNTNGQTCTWDSLSSSNTNTRAISLGASAITLTSNGTPWFTATTTGLTFTSGTSSLTFSANGPSLISLGSLTYYDVTISNTGSSSLSIAGGTNTFHNLTITGGNSKTGSVNTQAIVCSGTLSINGNSSVNRVLVQSSAAGSRRTYTAATVSLSNVTFQDIGAAGAAAPFSGTGLGDAQGNANITFDPGMTLYRTGSGGTWSDVAQWATDDVDVDPDTLVETPRTPRVPTAQDTVLVDDRATGNISLDMPRLGRGLDCSGFTGTLTTTVQTTLYGSLTLSNDPGVTLAGTTP